MLEAHRRGLLFYPYLYEQSLSMKEFITNKRKCKGKIKSAGTNPAEIFLSSCILPVGCFKKSYFVENFRGGARGDFSLFVVGVDRTDRGRKSSEGDLTGRPAEGLPGNPTIKPTLVYNLTFSTTNHTSYLLHSHITFPHIPLTHDTLYSFSQTLSKTTDPHNKKAPSANFLQCYNI